MIKSTSYAQNLVLHLANVSAGPLLGCSSGCPFGSKVMRFTSHFLYYRFGNVVQCSTVQDFIIR